MNNNQILSQTPLDKIGRRKQKMELYFEVIKDTQSYIFRIGVLVFLVGVESAFF